LKRLHEEGRSIAFEDKTAIGTRVAYVDYRADMGGFVEYIEMNDAAEARYTAMFTRALTWDQSDLILRL